MTASARSFDVLVHSLDIIGFAATVMVIAAVVTLAAVIVHLLDHWGWTQDGALPWEDSPGARNDRARLMEDHRCR